ncbi:hypothetical protein [Gellertiella hungarica]|uniref:Uncharacterized protein n=1 Tax=Gellertiella hungarica TaxID=1572859 RepID=A0A7W6J639_9HYPH|nr:hypothetical protein [Gellertiella hungarica]MBB4065472.1 hypothetical protein [Gellertiella hungarica]
MQSLISLLFTAGSVVALGFLGLVTLSFGLVLAAILSLTLAARAMMPQPKPAPVKATPNRPGERVTRIWNDGRGTIIDM